MYRLQFWKDAISSIYGISPLPVPRQPVAIALCSFAAGANSDMLLKLVETRQSTIGDRQFSDINAVSFNIEKFRKNMSEKFNIFPIANIL